MPLAVLASSNFTDPEHERLIWLAVGGLVALGLILAIVTVLWWRSTKGEHAALAPLEVMGDRTFPNLTHVEQSRRLEAVRLHLDGDVEPAPVTPSDEVDLDEALRSFQPGFDDLRDEPAVAQPTPDAPAGKPSRLAVEVGAVAAARTTDDEPPTPDDAPEASHASEPSEASEACEPSEACEASEASAPVVVEAADQIAEVDVEVPDGQPAAQDGADLADDVAPATSGDVDPEVDTAEVPAATPAADAVDPSTDGSTDVLASATDDRRSDGVAGRTSPRNGHAAVTIDPLLTGEPVEG